MTNPFVPPSHITDHNLAPFLSPDFSPVSYLNNELSAAPPSAPSTLLSVLASRAQSKISHVTALSTRLSATLTTHTDDILRVSPRLVYEVEILFSKALSLTNSLSESGDLHPAISQFVLHGLSSGSVSPVDPPSKLEPLPSSSNHKPPLDPLRTLIKVRALLTLVSEIFSLALSWPFPPSLLSPSPSLIALSSPPDPTLEAQGQAACARLRQEVIDLLAEGEHVDGTDGVQRARERVQLWRKCVEVWKGTGEEKARKKFVDGLEALVVEVEVRKKRADESGKDGGMVGTPQSSGMSNTASVGEGVGAPGYFRTLQRLREEIYIE